MENLDENNHDQELMNKDRISATAKENLQKSAGWVKVVAILGIVGSGLGALSGLFILFTVPILGFIYLTIYAIAIYISTLLLNVANSVERGSFDLEKFAVNFYKY